MVIGALTIAILALIQANNHSDDSDIHPSFGVYKLTSIQCTTLPDFGEDILSVDATACGSDITSPISISAGESAMCVKLAGGTLAYHCA